MTLESVKNLVNQRFNSMAIQWSMRVTSGFLPNFKYKLISQPILVLIVQNYSMLTALLCLFVLYQVLIVLFVEKYDTLQVVWQLNSWTRTGLICCYNLDPFFELPTKQ